MNNAHASKKIEEQLAVRRPNITKKEAARRRQVSLRRLRLTDGISVGILTLVLIALQFRMYEATSPDAPSGMLFETFLLYCGAVTLQLAFMLRTSVMRYTNDRFTSEDKKDHILRGIRFTYFVPLIGLLVLLPALFSGLFVDASMNNVEAAGLVLASQFITVLLAPLVAAFILFPAEMIVKGVVAVVRRDRSRMHYGLIGLLIAGLTLFILVGSAAVAPAAPFPAGSVQVVFALLGIPGDYEVQSELYLWVLRGIALFYAAFFTYNAVVGRREKRGIGERK